MPSFILIYPTAWPQYTNVTDKTHRDRHNSLWPGPRPTSVLSGILIYPAVWRQRTWANIFFGWEVGLCHLFFGGGGAGSQFNTMWAWAESTFMSCFILIHATIHQRYRQTDRTDRTGQQSDSIGRTVFWATVCKTVHLMLSDRCLHSVCLSCLSVCNVGVLWPNG